MTNEHTPTADEQPKTDDDRQQGEDTERPTVLVPLEVLEGESMPDGTSELLANARVILLGYHVIPEQTAAEQAREQFGETAMKKLDEFADRLTAAGAAVETRLVFTHEEQATINRIIYEHDCLAVLVPNSIDDPESVLVAVRGTVGVERTTQLVAGLFAGTDVGVTLYHILGPEENEGDAETLLNGVQTDLVERGMKSEAVATRIEQTETPIDAIARVGEEHDAVVMGETDPSVTTFVFGMPSKQVSERFLGPVLVVQREQPGDGDEAN